MDEIGELYTRLLTAWNSRSADDFAAQFTPDGVTIGFDGSVSTGPEIRAHLAGIFADHTPNHYVAKVHDVRPLGADVQVLHAYVGMVRPGESEVLPPVNAHQVVVAYRQPTGWRIALLQTTPAAYHGRPELVAQHTAEVQSVLDSGVTVG